MFSHVCEAKLKCVRYLWMETFFLFIDLPEEKKLKYCHKRPVFGTATAEWDIYFFLMQDRLDEVNKKAKKALLDKDAVEKKPATVEKNNRLITHSKSKEKESYTLCGGGKNIFHANFWIDQHGNHPAPETLISFSDVNNFIWKPVDRHQIDYCRYATREMENQHLRLKISHHERKILVILHAQNDFSDRVPGLYKLTDVIIDYFDEGVGLRGLVTNPYMYYGHPAYMRDDSLRERQGFVRGFRRHLDATGTEIDFVEILWDSDKYKPLALVVEGYNQPKPDSKQHWRHYQRLKYALHNKLRVSMVGDDRPVELRRFGRLAAVDHSAAYVRWDLSKPALVRVQDLNVVVPAPSISSESSTSEQDSGASVATVAAHFDVGCRVAGRSVRSGTPAYDISVTVPTTHGSSTSSCSKTTSSIPCPHPSLHLLGLGTVVGRYRDKTDTEFVEVYWDNENTCGNLPIQGSYADFTHTANLIKKNWEEYDEIIISRDCHRCNHISHKSFWETGPIEAMGKVRDGTVVGDMQIIEYMDVLNGKVRPVQGHFTGHCLNYIWELENQGRHKHIIWPTHCLVGDEIRMPAEAVGMSKKFRPCAESHYKEIGNDPLDLHIFNSSRGHEIVSEVREALFHWQNSWKKERKVQKAVQIVDIGASLFLIVVLLTENHDLLFLLKGTIFLWRRTAFSSLKWNILAILWRG
jgi:hypothetical protein